MLRATLLLFLGCWVWSAESFSTGTTQCSSPSHASGRGKVSPDLQVYAGEDSISFSSATAIRGFLVTGKGLIFSDIPEHAQLTDVCGQIVSAVTQSDSTSRESVTLRFRCEEGMETAELSIYAVFGYTVPHAYRSGRVNCPAIREPLSTTTTPIMLDAISTLV